MECNILIDKLPNLVNIAGAKFVINTDFRTGILFEKMMLDKEIEEDEKSKLAINLYYDNEENRHLRYIINNMNNKDEATDKLLWFYRCGREEHEVVGSKKSYSSSSSKNIYDYDFDQEYIYSAFLEQFNIDLQDMEYLHWWKFRALFNSLNENCKFSKILNYRSIDLSKVKDKDEKEFYKNMKALYEIPTKISKEEKEKVDAINEALRAGKDIKNLL